MHNTLIRKLVRAAITASVAIPVLALPMDASAGATRTPQDVARGQLIKLHVRLTRDALADPAIDDARDAATRAYALLYQVRENVLAQVRVNADYADLKLALWHQSRQLEGLHEEIPVSVQKILAKATDSLSIRMQINKIESDALDADDAYTAARDDLNAKVGEYQRLIREALDRVRFDPELIAMCAQMKSMNRAYGHTSRAPASR